MDKKEKILNLVLKYLDNISDEDLHKYYTNTKRDYLRSHSLDIDFTINGVDITLKKSLLAIDKESERYLVTLRYDDYLIIHDKRIQIYFDRLQKYINKINIEKENQNIDNILSRLQL